MEKNKSNGIGTHMTFIDFEKAYDRVPTNKLWTVMRRLYVKEIWNNKIKKKKRHTII